MPAFEALAQELGPKGLTVVGLFAHGGPAAGRSIAESAGLDFPLAYVGTSLLWKLGGSSVPATVFVGADGRVKRILHGTESRAELFAEGAALLE